jgi:nucleotide-binding universal stress UspA family protein
MQYNTILVHLDASARCDARIELAMQLAGLVEAHVVGLYAVSEPVFPIADVQWSDDLRTSFESRQRLRRDGFLKIANQYDVSAEWRVVRQDDPVDPLIHLRHADLLIAGQHDPYDLNALEPDGFITDALFASGRPVMVIPHAGTFTLPPRHIAIAWDASREAARAVADAMPLLRRASFVSAVHIDRADRPPTSDESLATLVSFLDAHGVRAHVARADRAPTLRTGEVLESRLMDLGADFLVMGAYAHSRARESIMGGVTRTISRSMTTPVLMSH